MKINRLIWLFAMLLLALSNAVMAAPTTPTADFTDNGDGTVTHKTTGLTWKRCAEGQTWSGGTCTGTAAAYTWAQATALTFSFAGKSDWRLPTIAELVTIVERENYQPAINATIFPGTPATFFWSASAYAVSSGYAWRVNFDYGSNGSYGKSNTLNVRLVRGGQLLDSSGSYTPTTDFTDNGDGSVTHKKTSLTWKRCSEGQTWSGSGCSGTASTHTWAQATALTSSYAGKNDWRLPTQNELLTIVERAKTSPGINGTIFPGTPSEGFWSASAYAATSSGYAWGVYFDDGYGNHYSKTDTYHVRLVRGGQSLGTSSTPLGLTGLSLSCPSTLTTSGSCSATATYTDNTNKSVSSTWTSSNATVLAVSSSGSLTAGSPTTDTPVTITASYAEGGVTKTATATVTVKAAAATLSGLSATCPGSLAGGASGSCTATATYSDGSSKAASPTWSSSNTSALTVSGGTLTAGNVTTDTPVTVTASHTEGSVTKTATATVTVKAATAKLSGLTISGDASVKSGSSITLTASGSYSDGSSHSVSPTWSVSDSSVATISNGVLAAKTVTTDTPLTVTASHTENGVTQTATWMVSVKAAAATVTSLLISGASSVNAGASASYTASAVYSDGTTKAASTVTWAASGTGATIDANGNLTAAGVKSDTTVTVTAIYTEGQTSKTATQTVTITVGGASACTGTGANVSGISVAGSSWKKLGDPLDVSYCLKNFNSASKFDIYVAVQLPDGTMLFLQTTGFFGTPVFVPLVANKPPAKYLENTLIPDKSGSVLSIPVLPMELPTGTYTFYAIPVLAGKDVFSGFNWIGNLAKYEVTLSK